MTILIDAILSSSDDAEAIGLINCSSLYYMLANTKFILSTGTRLVDTLTDSKQSPLHFAARRGKINIVAALIKQGVNINAIDLYGLTPLHHAIANRHSRVVVQLLEAHAIVEVYGSYKQNNNINHNVLNYIPPVTPLHLAVTLGEESIIAHLLNYNANVNARIGRKEMVYSKTVLEIAVLAGKLPIVNLLLDKSANVNTMSTNEKSSYPKFVTPLYHAFHIQRLDIVEILMLHGANPHMVYDADGDNLSILTDTQIQQALQIKEAARLKAKQLSMDLERKDPKYTTSAIGKFIISKDLFNDLEDTEIPAYFMCPIGMSLMLDPVISGHGSTYDRHEIERWFAQGKTTDPKTNLSLENTNLIPNLLIRELILDFLQKMLQQRTNDQGNYGNQTVKLNPTWA